jgi:hypothetical protein
MCQRHNGTAKKGGDKLLDEQIETGIGNIQHGEYSRDRRNNDENIWYKYVDTESLNVEVVMRERVH